MNRVKNIKEIFNNLDVLEITDATHERNELEEKAYNLATNILLDRLFGIENKAIQDFQLPLNKTAQEYYDILMKKL